MLDTLSLEGLIGSRGKSRAREVGRGGRHKNPSHSTQLHSPLASPPDRIRTSSAMFPTFHFPALGLRERYVCFREGGGGERGGEVDVRVVSE